MNPTDFCRDDWGKHFRDFPCNKPFYSSYLCGYGLISVVSLFLRQMSCQCQLQGLEVVASLGPLWLYQCPYQVGAFRKVLKGERTQLPPWPWRSPGGLVGVERHSSIMYCSVISLRLGEINMLDSVESFTETWPQKIDLCFSQEAPNLIL